MYADILRTLGDMAILVAALTWLSKTLLTAFLSKDLERFKSDLQASSQINIESFKATLQLEAQRHAVTYANLHSKRAEFIAELYSRIVELERGVIELSMELGAREARAEEYNESGAQKSKPWELISGIHTLSASEESKANSLHSAYREFMQFYTEKKIYFSPEVCNLIDSIANLTGYMGVMYQNVALRDDDNQPFVNPLVLSTWKKSGEKIPALLAAIESEFRGLLGVNNSSSTSHPSI